jgi:hypothetical protein
MSTSNPPWHLLPNQRPLPDIAPKLRRAGIVLLWLLYWLFAFPFIWVWKHSEARMIRYRASRPLNRNVLCPACGNRHKPGIVEWKKDAIGANGAKGLLVHYCVICRAEFGQEPFLARDRWVR